MNNKLKNKLTTDREGISDKNDCTVRAYQNAFGITYKEASEIASASGRVKRKGYDIEKILKHAGKKYTKYDLPVPVTLGKFVEMFGKQTAILRRQGHVFVIKNHEILDHLINKESKLILSYFLLPGTKTYKCPFKKVFGAGKRMHTQEGVVRYLANTKGWSIDQISEATGIQKTNVQHFYSIVKTEKE